MLGYVPCLFLSKKFLLFSSSVSGFFCPFAEPFLPPPDACGIGGMSSSSSSSSSPKLAVEALLPWLDMVWLRVRFEVGCEGMDVEALTGDGGS